MCDFGANILIKFLSKYAHVCSHDSSDCAFCRWLCAEES